MNCWRRTVRALAVLGLALCCACGSRDTDPPETIVLLVWEGVPREAFFDMPGGRVEAMPTLAGLEGLVRHDNYYPSSDRSETRLTTILAEDGRFPEPAGLLDWGARRRPEGLLAGELREAGFRRLAAVSRAELGCLDTQFDVLCAPPYDESPSAWDFRDVKMALDEDLERSLQSDEPLFLMLANDVLAKRTPLGSQWLAPYLRARLEPHAARWPDLSELLMRLDGGPFEVRAGIKALREFLGRRRGTPAWVALHGAESDARLALADRQLNSLLAWIGKRDRLDGLRLVLVGGHAVDPWSTAMRVSTDGRAPLYTLGFDTVAMDGAVQEVDLREALRGLIGTADPSAPRGLDGERPHSVSRVLMDAGETSATVVCRVGTGEREREATWLLLVHSWFLESQNLEDEALWDSSELIETVVSSSRVTASNRTAGSVHLVLRTPEGEELAQEGNSPLMIPPHLVRRREFVIDAEGLERANTTNRRPNLLATWQADGVMEEHCSIGSVPIHASDLPTVPSVSTEAWPEDEEPRLDLVADGRWQSVRVGRKGDGPVELTVEAWPPRLGADPAQWIALAEDTRISAHPLRGGAWVVRGAAPLEVRLERKPHAQFGYSARIAGERIGPEQTRIDGFRAITAGEVTILLTGGAWNDAALYGAAPEGHPLGLQLLGKPPAHEVTLPSLAEREFLLRAAARNQ